MLGTPLATANSMYWPGGATLLLGGPAQAMVLPEPGLQSRTTCKGDRVALQVRTQQEMMHLSMKAKPVGKGNLPLDLQEREGGSADVTCQVLQIRMPAHVDVNLTCLWSKWLPCVALNTRLITTRSTADTPLKPKVKVLL